MLLSWTGVGQEVFLNSSASIICQHLLTRHKTPALTTMLLHQLHIANGHATVYRFAHVINGG